MTSPWKDYADNFVPPSEDHDEPYQPMPPVARGVLATIIFLAVCAVAWSVGFTAWRLLGN